MVLNRRDIFLAAIVSIAAWAFLVSWSPWISRLSNAFALGWLAAFVFIIMIILLTPGRAISDEAIEISGSKSLALLGPKTWKHENHRLASKLKYKRAALYEPSFIISTALDNVLDNIIRDFVGSWYSHISTTPSFTNELDRTVRFAMGQIRDKILSIDIVEIVVSKFTPLMTDHLKDFSEAEQLIRGKNLNRNVTDSDELDLAIAAKYRQGQLHSAASIAFTDPKTVQQEHLRRIVEKVLPKVLPASQTSSRSVSVIVREIVACAILYPLLQLLSDPDTWNLLLEAYGRATLQDRKTVKKLRAALDQHASPNAKLRSTVVFPRLAPFDSERKFERFIRAARTCNHLSDARRFRNEVSSQLKRDIKVEGQDQLYLRRLEMGKQFLDRRVAHLAAGSAAQSKQASSATARQPSRLENAPLIQILHDASGLSSFMEYMERLHKMPLVQFWIVVDGLRTPLEIDAAEDEEIPASTSHWSESDRNDLAQISQAYMSRPDLKISENSRNAVKSFLKSGSRASPTEYHKARTAVLSAQTAVLEDMQKHYFPGFRESDLFYKLLSTDEASMNLMPSTPTRSDAKHSHSNLLVPGKPGGSSSSLANQPKPRPEPMRNANSSADLNTSRQLLSDNITPRRSFDEPSRAPLFDDDSEGDPLSRSRHSIDTDLTGADSSHEPDTKVVLAMEAALNDIIENPPNPEEDFKDSQLESSSSSVNPGREGDSPRDSLDMSPIEFSGPIRYGQKPSISSLGLVNTSSRIGVFTDDDLFPDEEKFIQDEHEDPPEPEDKGQADDIHEAAPGDLGLAEAISVLTIDIDKLAAQDLVVDSLYRKAELTNNTAELRILKKSKASLLREMRHKELQRQQYIVQESDNSLHGRSSVMIKSIMVGTSDDGREYALYVIEVQREAGEQMIAATWAIARRYSEFHDLHNRLRLRYPSVRSLEFPRRRVVMKLQKDFLQKRRLALEKYLRELLTLPDVCRSRELRSFLSQQAIAPPQDSSDAQENRQDIVSRFYSSVSDGVEDLFGNIPVLDQLSLAGQNLLSAATNHLAGSNPTLSTEITTEDPITNAEAEKELKAFEDRELEPFVKPICDIFLELFELNRSNNWLRGRAVVVVLHQLLGGTIERKVRENARQLVQEDVVVKYVDQLRDLIWPDGKLRQDIKPRTAAEKAKSRTEASIMLSTLLPDLAGSVVGRANSQMAARRVIATMNNPRLNTHLAYTFLDEIVDTLFGD